MLCVKLPPWQLLYIVVSAACVVKCSNWICRWPSAYNQLEQLNFFSSYLYAVETGKSYCFNMFCSSRKSVGLHLIWSVETTNRFLYKLCVLDTSFFSIDSLVFIVFTLMFQIDLIWRMQVFRAQMKLFKIDETNAKNKGNQIDWNFLLLFWLLNIPLYCSNFCA